MVVMQPIHFRNFSDRANSWPLYRPWQRIIHVQRPVRGPVMVIPEGTGQEPPQMSLVQDDYVIQAFAANTPHEPFAIRTLP